jgi:hypothetical protein
METTGEVPDGKLLRAADSLRLDMEGLASTLKDLMLSAPPEDLLGYLWGCLLRGVIRESGTSAIEGADTKSQKETVLVALEYVHAVLSCFDSQPEHRQRLREDIAAKILETAERLREVTGFYCIASSRPGNNAEFGDETGRVEFFAKSNWALIRGNRYQVLEEEFFRFVLEPHDTALRQAYGIGSAEIAMGIQAIANAMREGFGRAIEELQVHMDTAYRLADERNLSLEKTMEMLKGESPELIDDLRGTFHNMFMGGLCNLSRHTKLPVALLEDLSFRRGENTEFYAPGPFCGTPLRTLPARVRPLISLGDGFYASDPRFVRDAAYRAIERGLVSRLPDYREQWNLKQKTLTEAGFPRIFKNQLEGCSVLTGVYYRDVVSQRWVENDTLILLDDVLLQIEAKAGVGAMHSPATSFPVHVRAIQNLVVRAYKQAKRFIDYLGSTPEVALYDLRDGQYIEIRRVRLSDFRLVVPIGLTVESFAPFSAMCKELPEIEPILGKYPFVSMSIDDLFILNRFLPTAGTLLHYLEVRQQVAGIRGTMLFDETDHLGAYIAKNRIDMTLRAQLAEGFDEVTLDGFSTEIDRYFEGDRWLHESPPSQTYPDEIQRVLAALDRTRAPGWLRIDALLRDFGGEARTKLAEMLKTLAPTLKGYDRRWFVFSGDRPLLIWLQRHGAPRNADAVFRQAEVAAIATKSREIQTLRVYVTSTGDFTEAHGLCVQTPAPLRRDYRELASEAEALRTRMI